MDEACFEGSVRKADVSLPSFTLLICFSQNIQMQWQFVVKIKDGKIGEQRQVCNKTLQSNFFRSNSFSHHTLYFKLNFLSLP